MQGHYPIRHNRRSRSSDSRQPRGGVRPVREVLAELLIHYRIVLPEAGRQAPAVEASSRG